MKKKFLSFLGIAVLAVALASCKDSGDDPTKNIELKFNLCYGKTEQTMTYNKSAPITLPDGSTISSGALKPMWAHVAEETNSTFKDVAIQSQKGSEMMTTENATGFKNANIFGGNSIGETLMNFGTEGKFVNLSEQIEKGLLPNFKKYLDANPDVKTTMTAYDGNIYHIPYIAEIGEIARAFAVRESWVTKLLDAAATYDEGAQFNTEYNAFWTGNKSRTGANGGTVVPKTGVQITKKTNENIITLQNNLTVKNGKTLTETFVKYIKDNYSYTNPSELFLGEKAAYDIDELIALFRCVKANPKLLTNGKATVVYPLFARQSSYREDLMRLGTYFDGVRVHGSDSYGSRWEFDKKGDIQYTYAKEDTYNVLTYLSQMEAEGLIYSDVYDTENKDNMRTKLYGTDKGEKPAYGFMTYDFIASTTADSLNADIVNVLPPVSRVNGVWQYYMDNSRVVKPDGWAISVAGSTEAEITRACTVFDYFFSEKGAITQNYALPDMLEADEKYEGPDGTKYPKYKKWVTDTAATVAKGDLSSFLRDWLGCLMPIGYVKEIGFEYQYTSQRGFNGWKLLKGSTLNIPTYAGKGLKGDNDNYYKLCPPIFSMTKRESEVISKETKLNQTGFFEFQFNIIRFKTKGGAPDNTIVPKTYAEYLKIFEDAGLSKFIETYQNAYKSMLA